MKPGARLDKAAGMAVIRECQSMTAASYEKVLANMPAHDKAAIRAAFEHQQSVLSIASGMVDAGHDPSAVFELISDVGLMLVGTALNALHEGKPPCGACFENTVSAFVEGLSAVSGFAEADVRANALSAPVTTTRH